MEPTEERRRWRIFLVVWFGQLASVVGSEIARFALAIWVLQEAQTTTSLALVMTFMAVPMVVLWPVAGALADRWNRRMLMLLSDAGAGCITVLLFVLASLDHLVVWQVYVAVAVHSAFGALQWPAYAAAVPQLVQARQLGRANGLVELTHAVARVGSPLLGGVLLLTLGLGPVLFLDMITFVLATITLVAVRFPVVESKEAQQAFSLSLQIKGGWQFIRDHRGLQALFGFFVLTNFTTAFQYILLPPIVLGFASEAVLGGIQSIMGVGMVLGGIVVGWRGVPSRLIPAILGAVAVQGVCLVSVGWQPVSVSIGTAMFIYGLCLPFITSANQTLWQRKVSNHLLGRVLALRRGISGLSYPAAYIMAGPLVDHLFEPFLQGTSGMAGHVADLIGRGAGRGAALLVIIMGLLTVLVTIGAYLHKPLRHAAVNTPDIEE